MDSAGIDYHVMLAGNVFQQCLDNPGLQEELLCALCKQTSRIMTQSSKHGVQVKNKPSRLHTRVSFFYFSIFFRSNIIFIHFFKLSFVLFAIIKVYKYIFECWLLLHEKKLIFCNFLFFLFCISYKFCWEYKFF